MLVLLPPSETKRPGGAEGTRLDHALLRFPELTATRRRMLSALRELARDPEAHRRALRLGATLTGQAAVNRAVLRSATMPALDRFDGVLYEALDAPTLSVGAREAAGERVLIASALFGLLGALDPVPAYRLSPDSRLPGIRLAAEWRDRISALLAREAGLLLDLRSEAYRELGPAPTLARSVVLRVVSEGADGRRRALNHFNKAGKGRFVRALLESGAVPGGVDELIDWARQAGLRLEPGAPGELDLVV